MLLILFVLGPNFVGGTHVALLLDNSSGVIERPCRYETLLASGSLNVQYKTIRRKFLATSDSNYMARFCLSPSNGHKPGGISGHHQILNLLIVDLIRDLPLPELQSQVFHAHQDNIDRERHDRKVDWNLVVFLRVQYKEEQEYRQNILEMHDRVNNEIPCSEGTLVSIGIDFVLIDNLVRDQLMQFTALEFHLLLIELVLDVTLAPFAA